MPALIVHTKTATARSRAGHRFTREPSIVDVTEAQEAAIRADALLHVVEDKPAPAKAPEVAPESTPAPKAKR